MGEEWRVRVVFGSRPASGYEPIGAILRGRVGRQVSVSAGGGVFLYAPAEDAAEDAARIVRDVAAEQGLAVDVLLDRWDLACQDWVDRSGVPAEPDRPGRPAGRTGRTGEGVGGAVAGGLAEAVIEAFFGSR
jgi:hypothetical protein